MPQCNPLVRLCGDLQYKRGLCPDLSNTTFFMSCCQKNTAGVLEIVYIPCKEIASIEAKQLSETRTFTEALENIFCAVESSSSFLKNKA